jgi:hypothetical protein
VLLTIPKAQGTKEMDKLNLIKIKRLHLPVAHSWLATQEAEIRGSRFKDSLDKIV